MESRYLKFPGRPLLVTLGLVVITLAVFMISLAVGGFDINIKTVMRSFTRYDFNDTTHRIIQNIRLPRTWAAALTGMLLSLSGTILQGVMKNPLALMLI